MNGLRLLVLLAAVWMSSNLSSLGTSEEEILFRDDFRRDDAVELGNGWATTGNAQLKDQAALFQVDEEEFRPRIRHAFPAQIEGKFTVSFRMDWLRESEGSWVFYMQLGNSEELPRLLVYDRDLAKGIGVNLAWGGGDFVGAARTGSLGYFKDGEFHALLVMNDLKNEASIVEEPVVKVHVDVDAASFELEVNGETYPDLPFDNDVPIDTIRFITNGCSKTGFRESSIDEVVISKKE